MAGCGGGGRTRPANRPPPELLRLSSAAAIGLLGSFAHDPEKWEPVFDHAPWTTLNEQSLAQFSPPVVRVPGRDLERHPQDARVRFDRNHRPLGRYRWRGNRSPQRADEDQLAAFDGRGQPGTGHAG